MNIDSLTLGEIKEIAKLVGTKNELAIPDPKGEIRIVILQRGWVVVGRVNLDGAEYKITDASVIRNWGTKTGLGEIAKNGPTSSTVLDPAGTVRVHALGVVAQLTCEASRWKI
jgi:hypothetical protein